jgi:hypothetical protein
VDWEEGKKVGLRENWKQSKREIIINAGDAVLGTHLGASSIFSLSAQ